MGTDLDGLLDAVREAAGSRVWGAAVELARGGAVVGVSDDGEEIHLKVKARGRALPHEVYLWPEDADWGCDCELPGDACVHVAAAAIATTQSDRQGQALPEPKATYSVSLRYAFRTAKNALTVERQIVYKSGRVEPLQTTLADANVLVERADAQAESLLALHPGGPLPGETLRRLLHILEGQATATLDGDPVQLSAQETSFEVRVTDEGDLFKVGLYRPPGIDRLFRGAALTAGVLAPTSHGQLTRDQRQMLLRGVTFSADEVARLVSDYLPKLRERIDVRVATDRLPEDDHLQPRVMLTLAEIPEGMTVEAMLVYGDPPVAKITPGGALERLSGTVVAGRDLAAERAAVRRFEARFGLPVGYKHRLAPEAAVAFLRDKLDQHDGPVKGRVDPARFHIENRPVQPRIEVAQADDGTWKLDVAFDTGDDDGPPLSADPDIVLRAWRGNRSLVPLMDGGYAPLPLDWLKEHGALLRELLDGRDGSGRIERHATAALVELLEDTKGNVPPDLRRLREWLEGADGLPEAELPPGLKADLRPYQRAGLQWMGFLRDMSLSGVLADDMGLGKTVQALAAMLQAGGKHLVIAPTSVVSNWESEAKRFAPSLSVNVYHGPQRRLDDSDLTLTTYALLRIDLDLLRKHDWTYVVLDEAQAIKNPSSQTARSACKVPAKHRLALTGTPVENRLEELWSLFRFLMPGLLGSLEAFRERFSRPIESGSQRARQALRARVRPYVLRRMKQQVATELPPLTEMVVRCPLSDEQRKVYDTVRLAAREDVQRALADKTGGGSALQVLEALLRMRQACCDPSLLPGDIGLGVDAAKLDRLEDLLVEVVLEEHKALVFSQWTGLLDRVQPRLQKLGIDWVRLDGSTRDRQAVIDRFQSDDGPPVFLLSLKAGGTGLNLTAADYVIHLDPWWNPAVEQQATDRAHRIGQDKPVVSYKLIAERTVEERILELQASKKDLADAALGSDGGFLRSLTADELRALFTEDW
ncbi:MAG: helicase [Alphaproteobacteria bacterium]|nr:helicase [Alphaproteobacteria bacterium]